MSSRVLVIEKIDASEVGQPWSELLDRVLRKEARVVVEKSGVPVAAVVSTDDLARLALLDREREKDFSVIDELREAFQDVPEDEIEQEADRAIAAARARRRG